MGWDTMTRMTEYVAPPPPPNPYAAPQAPRAAYAGWWQRVGAYLLDTIFTLPGLIPFFIGFGILVNDQQTTFSPDGSEMTTEPTRHAWATAWPWLVLGVVLILGLWIWNRLISQGRTGYSWGKRIVAIQLIKESTGRPTGVGLSLLREFVHIVNGAICYLGWLWPLWDRKRQTWSDMITRTVVIRQPKG
jgi:uncharacterized RDD family membrane protein YckC